VKLKKLAKNWQKGQNSQPLSPGCTAGEIDGRDTPRDHISLGSLVLFAEVEKLLLVDPVVSTETSRVYVGS